MIRHEARWLLAALLWVVLLSACDAQDDKGAATDAAISAAQRGDYLRQPLEPSTAALRELRKLWLRVEQMADRGRLSGRSRGRVILRHLYNRGNFKLNRSIALGEWRQLAA